MNPKPNQDLKAEFHRCFKGIATHKHRYDVFRDFIVMAACSLHNSIHKEPGREEEYLKIINSYEKADRGAFAKLLALLVEMLEPKPCDVLGPLYMEMEVASKDQGQYFTPPEVSEVMAQVNMHDIFEGWDRDFITMSEPACGAGGMVLAVAHLMIKHNIPPHTSLWVQAIDVDRLAALMCYVQLSLWHIPAEIVVGNTLTLEVREVWRTPAHNLGFWDAKLANRSGETKGADTGNTAPAVRSPLLAGNDQDAPKLTQLGFDF
jgi:type I restriction-modification system DNA methylase subunit